MSTLRAGTFEIDLATPCVMGILNVTADSFYDGGRLDHGAAVFRSYRCAPPWPGVAWRHVRGTEHEITCADVTP